MQARLTVTVQGLAEPHRENLVIFVDSSLALPAKLDGINGLADLVKRAAETDQFKAKAKSGLVINGLMDMPYRRVIVMGTARKETDPPLNWLEMGGALGGRLKPGDVTVLCATEAGPMSPDDVATLALGLRLAAYRFDKYKTITRKKEDEPDPQPVQVTLAVESPSAVRKRLKTIEGTADGVDLARELVNEPPNVLDPETFAKKAKALKDLGVEVEVLDEKDLKKLGMKALLGVGQGSHKESHVVIMRWNGAKDKSAQPIAFIGKGVTFDTGGISIKPAASMEDMKGDMAGAACVVGLMHALASRKAKANVIGAIGLVENMPDGKAQRPGDIVTSMSGQTIEIINTDAEGRLVLADVLWYVQDTYKPAFMVNLATLTGAILVALGTEYAGLFSNNDALADRIAAAGKATGERVWRMPLDPAYDKIIDSKFADVKNSGGRYAGSITAAQFLQRFVNKVPWAHLDIAGTGMAAPQTDLNKSWGSGWGVRLLDRLVEDHYEGGQTARES